MKRDVWFQLARVLLATAFVAAGVLKLTDPEAFATSVATFRVVPREWSNIVAIWLPPLEILCGGLLFVRGWQRPAALGTTAFTVLFTVLLMQGMIRGLNMDCGCFGKWDPAAGKPAVALLRDVVLFALSLFCYRRFSEQSVDDFVASPS